MIWSLLCIHQFRPLLICSLVGKLMQKHKILPEKDREYTCSLLRCSMNAFQIVTETEKHFWRSNQRCSCNTRKETKLGGLSEWLLTIRFKMTSNGGESQLESPFIGLEPLVSLNCSFSTFLCSFALIFG